jgi:hypothetical protein
MLCASLARQDNVQKVILGVDGTAAAFLVTFSAAGKSNSHSRLEREAITNNLRPNHWHNRI